MKLRPPTLSRNMGSFATFTGRPIVFPKNGFLRDYHRCWLFDLIGSKTSIAIVEVTINTYQNHPYHDPYHDPYQEGHHRHYKLVKQAVDLPFLIAFAMSGALDPKFSLVVSGNPRAPKKVWCVWCKNWTLVIPLIKHGYPNSWMDGLPSGTLW